MTMAYVTDSLPGKTREAAFEIVAVWLVVSLENVQSILATEVQGRGGERLVH